MGGQKAEFCVLSPHTVSFMNKDGTKMEPGCLLGKAHCPTITQREKDRGEGKQFRNEEQRKGRAIRPRNSKESAGKRG